MGWTYEPYEVTEDELAAFVADCDEQWRGLSLTMPLKAAALELGEVDPLARFAGAANTLIFDGLRRRLYNTDVGGLVWAVRQTSSVPPASVTLLGSGATARSSLLSVAQLGAQRVTILARSREKAEQLEALAAALQLEVNLLPWAASVPTADLVISTVSSGAADAMAPAIADSAPLILDVVYQPWPTALASATQRSGATLISGLDLLVGQALGQIELMTGRTVAADILYAAGRKALASA